MDGNDNGNSWHGVTDVADVTAITVDPGRTMLPLRFVAESLGATADWNPDTKEIYINK